MPWINPVTDRTSDDVRNHTRKGVIQADDLNRIEENELYLSELCGVNITEPKTDWVYTDIPKLSDYARLLVNANTLRSSSFIPSSPETPINPLNTWQKFNDLEQILSDIKEYVMQKNDNQTRAGELFSGDTIGVM